MGAVGDRLHRAWHSPRSGPVILFVAGLPVLVALAILAVFPIFVAAELVRPLFQPGRVPFARASTLYLAYGAGGWAIALLLAAQAARIHRANRGLVAEFGAARVGGVRSAWRIAARLGKGLQAAGAQVIGEVIKEDYGAGIWLRAGQDRCWLAVSAIEGEDEVAITLAYDPALDLRARLTRRADRAAFAALAGQLRQVIAAEPALALRQP